MLDDAYCIIIRTITECNGTKLPIIRTIHIKANPKEREKERERERERERISRADVPDTRADAAARADFRREYWETIEIARAVKHNETGGTRPASGMMYWH